MKEVLDYIKNYFRNVDKILPIICIGITIFDVFLVNTMVKTGFVNESTAKTQTIAAILGVFASFAVSFFNYKMLSKYSVPLFRSFRGEIDNHTPFH